MEQFLVELSLFVVVYYSLSGCLSLTQKKAGQREREREREKERERKRERERGFIDNQEVHAFAGTRGLIQSFRPDHIADGVPRGTNLRPISYPRRRFRRFRDPKPISGPSVRRAGRSSFSGKNLRGGKGMSHVG
jgi:hypothetical protein